VFAFNSGFRSLLAGVDEGFFHRLGLISPSAGSYRTSPPAPWLLKWPQQSWSRNITRRNEDL
jgi:hypothetical protein